VEEKDSEDSEFEKTFARNFCGIASIMAKIGQKWRILVIILLGRGPQRYSELKQCARGIPKNMLAITLKDLEYDGLVTRRIAPDVPRRVDYELTPLGRSLWEPLKALGHWAQAHQDEIADARAEFEHQQEMSAMLEIPRPRRPEPGLAQDWSGASA